MAVHEVKKGIKSVGVIDWDRRLFDELIPLPDGTSYNSYLISGSEKTALIDTVNPPMAGMLLSNLKATGVARIDYVIVNHAEPDHSGSIPTVLAVYPEARCLCTPKCGSMLVDLLGVQQERITTVGDGETLSLGDMTLEFIHAPWVHWPETMLTYLKESKILFSCDFFGSHLATSDVFVRDDCTTYHAAKRFYAEIMMPFRVAIRKNIEKVRARQVELIAPSHGPVYDRPGFILDAYDDWISDKVKNEVVVAYVSMHGNTRAMVDYLTDSLSQRGISVTRFDLPHSDIGKLAVALVDASTLVLAAPTVLGGPHPQAVYAAYLANALRPKLRHAAIVTDYLWGGKAAETITSLLSGLKVELLPTVTTKGHPRAEAFKALDMLAEEIAKRNSL